MDKLTDENLYEILGVLQSATVGEIKKAYRKKALLCHPDKNPNNPRAAELFLELSKALEILIDESARSAYDKVLNAKLAAKLRHQELDDRRKRFKEELEVKERIAQEASKKYRSFNSKSPEEKLAAEIERLRKEGSKQLEEEMAYIREQINLEKRKIMNTTDVSQYRIKIKWQSTQTDPRNGGYNSINLTNIFSKYGEINALIVSRKKKGSALIEFENPEAAVKAHLLEKGLIENPLKTSWLNGEPPTLKSQSILDMHSGPRVHEGKLKESSKSSLFPSFPGSNKSDFNIKTGFPGSHSKRNLDDFEAVVLGKMREAEMKKRDNQDKSASFT